MSWTARLVAVMTAAVLAATVRADVYQYGITRLTSYTQTSNTPPAAPEYWFLYAYAFAEVPGEMLAASVSFDAPPPTTYPLYEATPTLQQHISSYYTSAAEFYQAYPGTTYTISVDRGAGIEAGDVFVPEDLYCPEVPQLTGDTFDRIQSLDTAFAFDGTINGFTPAAGTNYAESGVAVIDVEVTPPIAVWSVNLQPGDTTFQIPAGLLLPARLHSIQISYTNSVNVPNAGFATATSGAYYIRGTSALFTTLPNAVPCPGDADGDRDVDQDDLDIVLFNFGTPQAVGTNGDLDSDGDVDQDDLDLVLFYFATNCP